MRRHAGDFVILLHSLGIGAGQETYRVECLFSGESEDRPKPEHAIPRALGGRIRTRSSTCSRFNEACGPVLDEPLVEQWRVVTVPLAPAMAHEHRGTGVLKMRAKNGDTAFSLVPGGGLQRTRVSVLARDQTGGRPQVFAGPPAEVARRAREWLGVENPFIELELPPVEDDHVFDFDQVVTSPETEVAAVKAVLVSLDSIPAGDNSWVRGPSTVLPRQLVHEAVRHRHVPEDLYLRVVCGHDPELVPKVRAVALSVRPDLGPLDHVIIASGCPARRVVTATWSIFGHDAMSMYLATHYTGVPFTTIVVSPPVAGREVSVHRISSNHWALSTTRGLRALTLDPTPPASHLLAQLMHDRERAIAHAWVLGALRNRKARAEALFNWYVFLRSKGSAPETVEDLVRVYLCEDYARMGVDVSGRCRTLLATHLDSAVAGTRIEAPMRIRAGFVPPWAPVAAESYLQVLEILYREFGPPLRVRYPTLPVPSARQIFQDGPLGLRGR